MSTDHYQTLGISSSADEAQVRAAYKRLAKIHHPDKNPERRDEAERLFKHVSEV